MKYVLLSLGLALSSHAAYSSDKMVMPDVASIKKLNHEPLMASHLPKNLSQKMFGAQSLSYATGHEFYDAEVVLKDEDGKEIKYRDQLNIKKQHTLVQAGATHLVESYIWFFSPNGEDKIDGDFFYACTAENPCKNFNQPVIDGIAGYMSPSGNLAKLWVASGEYNLPIHPKQHSSRLLELYGTIAIAGRSSDFKYIAYGDERPLLKGTLSWNDYAWHLGSKGGRVDNLRMETKDNEIQVEDFRANVNIHSTRSLGIFNSDLKKLSKEEGSNLLAKFVYLSDSTLSSVGGRSYNVQASDYGAVIVNSSLSSVGNLAYNLYTSGSSFTVQNSQLEVKLDSCGGGEGISIFSAESLYNALVDSSKLSVELTTDCPRDRITLAGIVSEGGSSESEAPFSIINSEIQIKGGIARVFAIFVDGYSLLLDNVKVNAESIRDNVVGVVSDQVEFTGKPSTIHIASPEIAELFISNDEVMNQSTPPSQCSINDAPFADC